MKKSLGIFLAMLLCFSLAAVPIWTLAEADDELSVELANGWDTGIEEGDDLSYEQAHDLPTGISGAIYAYVKTANGKSLNLRADVDAQSTVITTIPYGAKVKITGYYSSSWAAVVYGSHNGYCMTRYLSDKKPAAAGKTDSTSTADTSTDLKKMFKSFQTVSYAAIVVPSTPTGYVNLRWAPTKNAPTEAIYRSGDVVSVIAEGKGWLQLYDAKTGISGFMMSQFLTRIPDEITAPEAAK